MEEVNAQEWLRKFWENKNNERGLDLQQKKIHSETTEEFDCQSVRKEVSGTEQSRSRFMCMYIKRFNSDKGGNVNR